MNISYDLYRLFYIVAERGSITAAAEALYVSQPAVSQSIRQLEEGLGCRLFVRTAKGVTLTAEGRELYSYVAAGIGELEKGEKRLSALVNLDSGEMHIGASDMTLEYFLLPYLERFHKRYPGIKLRITNGPTPETVRLLAQGEIEFGVISEPAVLPEDIQVTPVRDVRDIFICGPEYRELAERKHSVQELAEYPLIMLEKGTSTRAYVDAWLAEHGMNRQPDFELATSSLIVQFVKRNLGIGCVVEDFAKEAIESGLVYPIQIKEELLARRFALINRKAAMSKASERLLGEILNPAGDWGRLDD